jgi:hypothetical protein
MSLNVTSSFTPFSANNYVTLCFIISYISYHIYHIYHIICVVLWCYIILYYIILYYIILYYIIFYTILLPFSVSIHFGTAISNPEWITQLLLSIDPSQSQVCAQLTTFSDMSQAVINV